MEFIDLFFERHPNAMLIFDMDTLEILNVNQSFTRKYGYTKSEATELSIEDIRPKKDLPELRRKLNMVAGNREKPSELGNVRHLTKDGKVLHVQIVAQHYPFEGENTKIVHIHDITEVVNLKNKCKNTPEDFDHHFDENPLAMVEFDKDVRITEWSKRAKEKLGYTSDDVQGKTAFDIKLFSSEERENIQERIKRITTGKVNNDRFSTIAVKKDGSKINIRIHASALRAGKNEHKSVVAFIENITPYKRLELLFKNTQKMAQIGGWEYTPEEENLFWTDEVYRIHEVPVGSEIDVKGALTFYTAEGRSKIEKGLNDAINKKKSYDIQVQIITGKGNRKWVRAMGRPVIRNNQLYKITGTFEDITEQKIREEEINENAKEKEVLLAEIHHRVKNNLAIISGLLELKALDIESEEMREILRQSQLRIQSMSMIHEALYEAEDFSNLEFADFVEKLISAIEATHGHGEKDIKVTLSCSKSLELNVNQAIPCGLVINELITNAFKHAFSDRMEGVINVAIDYEPQKDEVVLQVSDNGKGLPKDFKDGRTRSLGATLIKQLATQLDGTLTMKNTDGASVELRFKTSDRSGSSSQHFNFN